MVHHLYTILVQKWGVGAYMVMGAYKVLYSTYRYATQADTEKGIIWAHRHRLTLRQTYIWAYRHRLSLRKSYT